MMAGSANLPRANAVCFSLLFRFYKHFDFAPFPERRNRVFLPRRLARCRLEASRPNDHSRSRALQSRNRLPFSGAVFEGLMPRTLYPAAGLPVTAPQN